LTQRRKALISTRRRLGVVAVLGGALAFAFSMGTLAGSDFGSTVQSDLFNHSQQLFGVNKALDASAQESISQAEAVADPTRLVSLAHGLTAEVVTTQTSPNTDMIALWPNSEHPTHLIACNEQGTAQPGLERIDLATGAVNVIVTGTTACDPAKRTPWGHDHLRRGSR
jgi:hypothetical protein